MSHPAWDAWIEIYYQRKNATGNRVSHPAWDAWIEIQRGRVWQAGREVASRMGCVD